MIEWVRHRAAATFAAAIMFAFGAGAAAEPRVVASIAPVQSLVAGVMAGGGAPELIVRGTRSPHAYALRPSEAQALHRAEIVFWIGPIYESFLEKPLASLAGRARIVELARSPGVVVLPAREGGSWDDEHGHGHGHGKSAAAEADGHLFLDPENAKAIVRAAAATLAAHDAANAARYSANGERVLARLDALDTELARTLAPVRGKPFIVFHDAYQYFERRYGLAAVGSITVSPERPPGAQRLQRLRRKIASLNAVCVFSEPQFEPALVQTVVERTRAKTAVLDPLGASAAPTPDAYFDMMRALARSLSDCLAG